MSSPPLEILRTVNFSLRARLSRLPDRHSHATPIAPSEFTDMLADLRQATECLRSLPVSQAPFTKMAHEICEYRSHLQQLEKILPSVQARLLIEKARLQTARTHVAKAVAWAEGSKKTL
jgi:hypothetical protein